MNDLSTRAATAADTSFLWRMLTFAASMRGTEEDIERAKIDPELRGYVEGFGRAGDLGIIVVLAGRPVGAAWLRLLAPGAVASPSKVWTHDVPELAIAVEPSERARGLGNVLLHALLSDAGHRYPAVALTVREGNAAVRLYERFAFAEERRVVNRVGGVSLVMRRSLL
ncbi:Histone acetyltransferase HPA2 [Minicystis rosea]|nr:Histone acetyltransferase HPA2 [Minicystis rosea]